MSDEFDSPFAPAPVTPAPAPSPEPPPIPADVAPISDEQAFEAAKDPTAGAPTTAAPGSELPQGRKPKYPFYRDLASGDVYTALRTPPGYEDDHPDLYEGLSELPKGE